MIRECLAMLVPTGEAAFFADILPTPSPNSLFEWLACGVAVAGIYYLGLRIVQAHKRNPPIDADLSAMERRLDQKRSVSVAGIYDDIKTMERRFDDEMRVVTAALAGAAEIQKNNSAQIAEQNRQINVILLKLPRSRS